MLFHMFLQRKCSLVVGSWLCSMTFLYCPVIEHLKDRFNLQECSHRSRELSIFFFPCKQYLKRKSITNKPAWKIKTHSQIICGQSKLLNSLNKLITSNSLSLIWNDTSCQQFTENSDFGIETLFTSSIIVWH